MATGKERENTDKSSEGTRQIIVIGRQFGSGGRRIGQLLASKLGYAYYDKELLAKAADSLGYSKDIFIAHDEKKPSPMRSLLQGLYGIADNFHDTSICGESLYRAQSEVIKKICSQENCVIVGRTADYILRKEPRLLSIFLHAPIEHRAARIMERNEAVSHEEARDMAKRHDKTRESYYNYYTGGGWGKASNYHLSIDASCLDDEEIADVIINFAKNTKEHTNKEA